MEMRLVLLLAIAVSTGSATPPNFVFIFADDQAWNGLSSRMIRDLPESGSDYHLTPNTDSLGLVGMTFSSAYAAVPNPTPSPQ